MEKCGVCRFWLIDVNGRAPEKEGICRRYPPSPDFPLLYESQWCGEFIAIGRVWEQQ